MFINSSDFNISDKLPKFVFLVFITLSSGYIPELLSCQMRKLLKNSLYLKHLCGIIMIFSMIMYDGALKYDISEENNKDDNLEDINVLKILLTTIPLYFFILISSKTKLIPNLIFYGLLCFIYMIKMYRNYLLKRDIISESTNKLIIIEKIISLFVFIVLIYGFYDYYLYQKQQFGKQFSWEKFLLETHVCVSVLK